MNLLTVLSDAQKLELNALAVKRVGMNTILTDPQELDDTLADYKAEWAAEIVKEQFNPDDELDEQPPGH